MTVNFQSMPQRSGDWTWFKAMASVKGFLIQHVESNGTYFIYGYDGPEVLSCVIWTGDVPNGVLAGYSQAQNDTDKAEFETAYKPTSNRPISPVDVDGLPVQSPSAYEYAKEEGGFDGYLYSCPANTISIFDEPVTKVLFIQGAICWWDTPSVGDYGEFSIVDKDGVIPDPYGDHDSLMEHYGLTPGVDVLELSKYVRKFRPPPWAALLDVRQRTAGKILPGLYMRFIYNNTHVSNVVDCGVNYVDYAGD